MNRVDPTRVIGAGHGCPSGGAKFAPENFADTCWCKVRLRCATKLRIINVAEEVGATIPVVEMKFGTMKLIGDQIRDSLNKANAKRDGKSGEWKKLSLIVDPGACGNVADPRDIPGHPLKEAKESMLGCSSQRRGGPIPQLGEKEAMVNIVGGALRKFKAQCATVSKPLLSVKGMTEAGHFVWFCEQGRFLLDLKAGHLE